MPLDPQTLVPVGHVGKPHGLLGGFFAPLAPSQQWAGYSHVYLLEKHKEPIKVAISKFYYSGGKLVLCLVGYTSRSAIEGLVGTPLAVDRTQIPMGPEEWLVHDLVGCSVWVGPSEKVGTVKAVKGFGAQDCLEIALDSGGDLILYPFIEPFVQSVDMDNKKILVLPEPAFLGEG